MDPRIIAPLLTAALVIWALYRRARRVFGRQRVVESRMWVRIAVLTIVGAFVLFAAAHQARSVAALIAGVACGAALGYVGLRHTRFEVTTEGRFYTPHAYIGLAVTALFVGRVLYRFLALYAGLGGPAAYAGAYGTPPQYAYQNPFAYQRSPLTLAIFGALVGYYVLFYLGVLLRARQLAAAGRQAGAM